MREVENYMQHIRNLSEEREALTEELEQENHQLKECIERLEEEREGIAKVFYIYREKMYAEKYIYTEKLC